MYPLSLRFRYGRQVRLRLIGIPALTVLVAAIAIGVSVAAAPKKVGGSVKFSLTTPPTNSRDGQFSGKVSSKSFCLARRVVTLFPASDNFPNTTGFVRTVKTKKSGAFSGAYTTPNKAGTSTFTLRVDKARRTHNGKTVTCKSLSAPGQSVTTTGHP